MLTLGLDLAHEPSSRYSLDEFRLGVGRLAASVPGEVYTADAGTSLPPKWPREPEDNKRQQLLPSFFYFR